MKSKLQLAATLQGPLALRHSLSTVLPIYILHKNYSVLPNICQRNSVEICKFWTKFCVSRRLRPYTGGGGAV